ncbi:elongation factor P 5-aminopentanone reductase [Anaerosporobacter faecicola]|uniref:elongation factor P 5-aminopentanone reductase n=1 Tax=Anaerosporobacter faecicola TaxID=2718714 RepID=UPI001438E289|nr:SDR family NAD(P)-dependent oxidoreductase [Anaerosporobacter faecicola]
MIAKTVIVTGASRGIGRATALYFAKAGYHVAISCQSNAALLKEVEEEILSYGVRCISYVGNMGEEEHALCFCKQALEAFGHIDVLINNAGISMIGLLSDLSLTDWNTILTANLTSVFLCSKAVIPSMVHQKSGRIINISSVWGIAGASCEVAYSATKGGINSFTKALAKELAPSNVQVNAIACGTIDTQMNQFLSQDDREALESEIPSGRFASPTDVAEFVFAIATGNSYLTGQVIPFDGAWL